MSINILSLQSVAASCGRKQWKEGPAIFRHGLDSRELFVAGAFFHFLNTSAHPGKVAKKEIARLHTQHGDSVEVTRLADAMRLSEPPSPSHLRRAKGQPLHSWSRQKCRTRPGLLGRLPSVNTCQHGPLPCPPTAGGRDGIWSPSALFAWQRRC